MHGLKFATLFLILLLHGQVNPLPNIFDGTYKLFIKGIVDPLVKAALNGNMHFMLHNREHPEGQSLTIDNYDTVFPKTDKELKVIISGWQTDGDSLMPQTFKDAYLATQDVNIIIVDWRKMSKSPIYLLSARGVFVLGECVAQILSRIYGEKQTETKVNVHIIGHSLGAHAAGIAGRSLKQKTGQIPYRITGLDPADPLIEHGLRFTDAVFVDVIHSSSDALGIHKPLGHADFYPNGGEVPQPGCPRNTMSEITCSHSASWKYYGETIENPKKYLARRCNSYKAFFKGQCGDSAYMGEGVSLAAEGTYYLLTYTEN